MTKQTDLDDYLALLDRSHVGYTRRANQNGTTTITSEVGIDMRVTGYPGFIMAWEFDQDGRFITVGVWE